MQGICYTVQYVCCMFACAIYSNKYHYVYMLELTKNKILVKTRMCDSCQLSLQFPAGTSYAAVRLESTNGCVVVVWFTDMNCASTLPENKFATTFLQACAPSTHVWSVSELPLIPQFSNQAPPGAQQLSLPDFLRAAHLGHMGVIFVAVTAGVGVQILVK